MPSIVSAVAHDDKLEFTTVCEPNRTKLEWEVALDLNTAQIKVRSEEFAKKGFPPQCVTAYPGTAPSATALCG